MDSKDMGGDSGRLNIAKIPRALEEHLDTIRKMDLFIAVVTDNYVAMNVQCALELGTAILSSRKIGFLIKKGTVVPNKMLVVADSVEYFTGEDIKSKGDILFNRLCGGI
jgi:hypothetical protein